MKEKFTPRQVIGFIGLLLAVAFFAIVFNNARAQGAELPEATFDLEAWAGSAAALAAAVLVVVAFAKRQFNLHGWQTLAASFGLAVVGSVALHFTGHIDTIAAAVAHGFSAGVLASGGWDALAGLFGGGGKLAPASTTRTDAAKSRLSR